MLFRLAHACGLIASTVAIEAFLMSAELSVFRYMEKNRRDVRHGYPTFVTERG
ncbi:hypothetical protein ILFOPFJJ_05831 [Ensifer psoraleae]|nr:hypothetical protein [Sinorhizobium psoraleae]